MRALPHTIVFLAAAALLWAECSLCQPAVTKPTLFSITQQNLAITGAWLSNCYKVEHPTFNKDFFSQNTYIFSATGNFSLEVNRFSDSQCQEYLDGNDFYGTYQLGEKLNIQGGGKAHVLHMNIDNASGPDEMATQVDWLLQLDQNSLRFGALNSPFNWINNSVVFQKLKGQGPMVF
ncbi:MAG: hypothetical protein RL497_2846 [Pseudomonadota bacterium]|jgi:hypothetical protein